MNKPSTQSLRHARRWLKWVRRDAQLYGRYRQAAMLGDGERHRAYRAWRENSAKMPNLPGDAALKWIREHD